MIDMCHVASASFAASVRSPGRARSWTQGHLDAWNIHDGVLTLLVSELMTNAVLHARTPAILTLALTGGRLDVHVSDLAVPAQPFGPGTSTHPADNGAHLAGSGRGLRLVDALTDAWGVTSNHSGKQVWFRRQVTTEEHLLRSCPCEEQQVSKHPFVDGDAAASITG
jgi:anti-sigma regulatory factor (Ser/Thr protein kinase)